jgi:hypothetical protein
LFRWRETHDEKKGGTKVVKEDKGERDSRSRFDGRSVFLHIPSLLDLLTVMTA